MLRFGLSLPVPDPVPSARPGPPQWRIPATPPIPSLPQPAPPHRRGTTSPTTSSSPLPSPPRPLPLPGPHPLHLASPRHAPPIRLPPARLHSLRCYLRLRLRFLLRPAPPRRSGIPSASAAAPPPQPLTPRLPRRGLPLPGRRSTSMATAPGAPPLGLNPGVRRRPGLRRAPPARARRGARRSPAPARPAPAPAQGVAGRCGAPSARMLPRCFPGRGRRRRLSLGRGRGRRQGVGPRRRLPVTGVSAALGRRGICALPGVAQDVSGALPHGGPRSRRGVERPLRRPDHGVDRVSWTGDGGVPLVGGTPWPSVCVGCLSLW